MKYKYHYTYRITNILLKMYYYGVRSTNLLPKDDIGIKYFSTSTNKEFIRDQKENPQNYHYKVIKNFNTREEATALEIKLHEKFNVKLHEKFYNRANQTSTGFDTTGVPQSDIAKEKNRVAHTGKNSSCYGKYLTKEHKKKISESSKGKKKSEKHKENQRKPKTSEHKMNMSIAKKGKNSPRAKVFKIYDSNGLLEYTTEGNFKQVCEDNNLPYRTFQKSIGENCTPIYTNLTPMALSRIENSGNDKYIGWYIVISKSIK